MGSRIVTLFPTPTRRATSSRPRRPKRATRIRLDEVAAEAFAAGTLRLLAVDQGSQHCGLAYFVGDRVTWTKRLSPSEAWSWRRRMRWITDHLRELLTTADAPHVLAIEDVAFGVSASTALTMGKQVGWLMCALEHWYPGVPHVAVNPATVRAAHQAGARREKAKERFREVARYVLGAPAPSQDEADAVCIALAVIERLRRERMLARVEEGESKGERKAEMV